MTAAWHTLSPEETLARLATDPRQGLTAAAVAERTARYGANQLPHAAARSPWSIFAAQFASVLVGLLVVAAVVSVVLGERADALAILAILLLNAALGFVQEYRAEQAIAALAKLAAPSTNVLRDGRPERLPAAELVPGDIIQLAAGDFVPADCRLLQAARLRTQEAALTGEGLPVSKDATHQAAAAAALGDRHGMVYLGTTVVAGRGTAVVALTGAATELGRVAGLLHGTRQEETPLQKRLAALGRRLALAAVVLTAVVFGLGLLRGGEIRVLALTAVSLAVAAVPEGLAAAVTVALALGSQRMLRRRALVRRLAAVETLGAVTVICSDKTGTLTENRMRVVAHAPGDEAGHRLTLTAAALCNDARLAPAGTPAGDPTEIALLEAAADWDLRKEALEAGLPRVGELPFDSERKCMTTVHQVRQPWAPLAGRGHVLCVKGAFDVLLERATSVWWNGQRVPLDAVMRQVLRAAHDSFARRGLRVMAVGCRVLDELPAPETWEQDLMLLGLLGLADPVRPGVPEAVARCHAAGIRTIMVTGDHPVTAQQVARQLNFANTRARTGQELSGLTTEGWDEVVRDVAVLARVSPEDKLRLVEALQRQGHVVAMTGDGVNDGPALKRSDVGVAMGRIGTDVAREAADMVLEDDNFATIVAAVEEGRAIDANLRRFLLYLLGCNAGEIAVMLLGPLFGMPLPLLPLQILWMNLVTDGFPALALGVEPAAPDSMQRPPRRTDETLLGGGTGRTIVLLGLLLAGVTLVPGVWLWRQGVPHWQSVLFTIVTTAQLAMALACRSRRRPLWRIGLGGNPALLGAVAGTFGLQMLAIYAPPLQRLLGTAPLTASELGLALGASAVLLVVTEVGKALQGTERG